MIIIDDDGDEDDNDDDDAFNFVFYLFLYLIQLLFVLPYLFSCEFCVDGVWSSMIVIRYGP